MEFNNFFEDENSSKDGFEIQEFLSPNNLKLNQVENIEDKNEIVNKVIYVDGFEKAFNTVFNQKNTEIQEDIEQENENSPPAINDKINENSYIQPLSDERIIVNVNEQNDKFFPFTKGIGLEQTLKNIGLSANYKSSSKISLMTYYNNQYFITSKFRTTDYYTDEKGKRRKQKKIRKFKPDDIRKKIKARFHKIIKNIINIKLKKAGAKKLFDFFPQNFITNITVNLNSQALNLTYEKLIELDFSSDSNRKRGPDIEKYNKNLEVLKYLNENDEICKKSDFEKIKNMKYIDILRAYFSSMEFEQSIIELYQKKEKIEYIEEYVNKAINYVNFFAVNKKKLNDTTTNIIKIINSNEEDIEEGEREY